MNTKRTIIWGFLQGECSTGIACRWFLIMIFLSILAQPSYAQLIAITPNIYHQAVLTAPAGQSLDIGVTIEEGIGDIVSASLLWKAPGRIFNTLEMESIPGGMKCTIPSDEITAPQIEYAIIIEFTDGSSVSYPLADPLNSPQVIAVIEPSRRPDRGPEFVILYPQEEDVIFTPEVKIALSIFDPDSSFNPSSVEVYLDGKKIKIMEVSRTYLFAKIEDSSPGKHTILIRSKDFYGAPNPDFGISFNKSGKVKTKTPSTFYWAFTGQGIVEDFNRETEGIARGDFRIRGQVGSHKYSARVYKTSEEAWDRQPQDRFSFNLQGNLYHLNMGDTYPIFSELMLSGRRVRGVELGLHFHSLNLVGVYGEINKPIEGSTYSRYLMGIKPYFATKGGFQFGLSVLKAKDDIGSVTDASLSPRDNIVAGMDVTVPLFKRKLEWSFNAAMSLTAMDITGGAISQADLDSADIDIPFDPQAYESIIIINESLTPPNPLELGSLAWLTKLSINKFGQLFSLNYRVVGPSYISLGNPYLQNDLKGWVLTDQFSLFKRRLFVNIGLDSQSDNVMHTKDNSTTMVGGWITLAVMPLPPAPNVTLSMNYHRTANGIDEYTPISSDSVDRRREDASIITSLSLIQNLFFLDRKHVVTVNMNRASFEDQIGDRPQSPYYTDINSSYTNLGLFWRTDLTDDYDVTGDYAYYSNKVGGTPNEYHLFGCTLSTRFLQRKMKLSIGGHRRMGEDIYDRWQYNERAEWEFYPLHALRADAVQYFNDNYVNEGLYRLYYIKRF